MFSFKTEPQSMKAITIDGFRLYGASISKIWYWQIIFLLPVIFPNLMNIFTEIPQDLNNIAGATYRMISVLIVLFGFNFVLTRIYDIGRQKDYHLETTASLAAEKLLPVFIALIFIVALASIFLSIALIITFITFVGLMPFAIIPFIFTLIVAAGILSSMIFIPALILFENYGAFSALFNSKKYQYANRKKLKNFYLNRINLPSLLATIIILTLGFILFIFPLWIALTFDSLFNAPKLPLVWMEAAKIIMFAFAIPIFYSIELAMFNDLKLRTALLEKEIAENLAKKTTKRFHPPRNK